MAFLYELATRLVWELKSYGRLEPKFSSIQTLGTIIYPAIRVNQRVQSAVTVLCRLHYLDLNHSQSQSQPRTSLAVMEVSEVQRTAANFIFGILITNFQPIFNFQRFTMEVAYLCYPTTPCFLLSRGTLLPELNSWDNYATAEQKFPPHATMPHAKMSA
jgi:hypothetical protein